MSGDKSAGVEGRFMGRVALVTGASSGIGRAVALALVREGAAIGAFARRAAVLDDVVTEIEALGCQALDLAAEGIRVNSVSPGWVWTPVVDQAAEGDRERWEQVWGPYHPMNRVGEPAEIAAAIAFLASDDASFVTGADLPVDGGYLTVGGEGSTVLEMHDD